jgi:hypothetical protein
MTKWFFPEAPDHLLNMNSISAFSSLGLTELETYYQSV